MTGAGSLLRLIRNGEAVTRADLVRRTGLARSTVAQRLDALLTYPITVLGCTPSYALFLAEAAARKGIDLAKASKLRITWHTGEPGASIPATRAKIESAFGVRAYDLPGLTEIAAWGFECDARAGLTRMALGSTAERVLQGSAPVLLLRPDGAAGASKTGVGGI